MSPRQTHKERERESRGENKTLVVAGREEDGGGIVADEALGNTSVGRGPTAARGATERRRVAGLLIQDGGGRNDLDDEVVSDRSRLQFIHLHKHRLPLRFLDVYNTSGGATAALLLG